MSKLKDRTRKLWRSLVGSLGLFPMELLFGVGAYAYLLVNGLSGERYYAVVQWFIPTYLLIFSLNRWTRGRRALCWLYWLSPLLLAAEVIWHPEANGVPYAIAFILLLLAPEATDNRRFGRNMWNSVLWTAAMMAVGVAISLLAVGIETSIRSLFSLVGNSIEYIVMAVFFIVVPLLCCIFVTENGQSDSSAKLRKVASDYILAPAAMVYTVMLLVYACTIAARWELPNGGLAYMVTIYLAISLGGRILHEEGDGKLIDWFYRWQPVVSVVPLALMWVGIVRRLSDYGLTEDRVYLILTAVMVTVGQALLLFGKTRRYSPMLAVAALLLLMSLYLPYFNANDMAIRSQTSRLERLLPEVTDHETGRFVFYAEKEYETLPIERLHALEKANDAISYLQSEMPTDEFKKKFEVPHGEWGNSAYLIRQAIKKAEKNGDGDAKEDIIEDSRINVTLEDVDIDLSPYTILTDDFYMTSEKRNAVVRRKSDHEPIMQVDMFHRFDSLMKADGQIDKAKYLTMKNDTLMVVIGHVYVLGMGSGETLLLSHEDFYKKKR